MLPFEELLLVSLGLSLLMAVIYRLLINPKEIRGIKSEMKHLQGKVKKAQKDGNKGEVDRCSKAMLKMSSAQMKFTMKPMFATMIIFMVALGWMTTTYAELAVMLPFALPFLGMELNWFWWYLIIVLPGNMIFRKALGVE